MAVLKTIVAGIALCMISAVVSEAQVQVRSYYKRNGTFVPGHWRSSPDGIKTNNWSYPGNSTPYHYRGRW